MTTEYSSTEQISGHIEEELDYHIYKQYEILGLVGKGTYGQVYKVKHKKTQQLFAIKKICDAFQNITDAKRTYRELNYLFQIEHPCIVKLYSIVPPNGGSKVIQGGNGKISVLSTGGGSGLALREANTSRTQAQKRPIFGEDASTASGGLGYITQKTYHEHNGYSKANLNKHVYAVFQYIESDLAKALRLCPTLQSIQRKYIAFQLVNGLSYLHNCNLIHRDIKPSNILIDSNCDIKICDFGLCRLKDENETKMNVKNTAEQQTIITEYVASRWYRAPQILLGFSPCNEAIDMWGLGCVLAQLILKSPIFQGNSTMDQLEKIFRVIGIPNELEINLLQTDHAKFILRNFTFSRKNKPQKLSQVLSQASDEEIDLIENLLQFNPLKRMSAKDTLKHSYFRELLEMNYKYDMYNYPVKIIDHTQPNHNNEGFKFLAKNFSEMYPKYEERDHEKTYENQESALCNKKSQNSIPTTIEQYQSYIEELERVTSRSSNRVHISNDSRVKQSHPKKRHYPNDDRVIEHNNFEKYQKYQVRYRDMYQPNQNEEKKNSDSHHQQPSQISKSDELKDRYYLKRNQTHAYQRQVASMNLNYNCEYDSSPKPESNNQDESQSKNGKTQQFRKQTLLKGQDNLMSEEHRGTLSEQNYQSCPIVEQNLQRHYNDLYKLLKQVDYQSKGNTPILSNMMKREKTSIGKSDHQNRSKNCMEQTHLANSNGNSKQPVKDKVVKEKSIKYIKSIKSINKVKSMTMTLEEGSYMKAKNSSMIEKEQVPQSQNVHLQPGATKNQNSRKNLRSLNTHHLTNTGKNNSKASKGKSGQYTSHFHPIIQNSRKTPSKPAKQTQKQKHKQDSSSSKNPQNKAASESTLLEGHQHFEGKSIKANPSFGSNALISKDLTNEGQTLVRKQRKSKEGQQKSLNKSKSKKGTQNQHYLHSYQSIEHQTRPNLEVKKRSKNKSKVKKN